MKVRSGRLVNPGPSIGRQSQNFSELIYRARLVSFAYPLRLGAFAVNAGNGYYGKSAERTRMMMSMPSVTMPAGSDGNPETRISAASMSVSLPDSMSYM